MGKAKETDRQEFPLTMTRSGGAPQDLAKLGSHFARLSEIYATQKGLDLADLLPALAAVVVELHEYPAGDNLGRRREALLCLRTAIDSLYPSSVWADDTRLIDGRFAWALRQRIALNLQMLDEEVP